MAENLKAPKNASDFNAGDPELVNARNKRAAERTRRIMNGLKMIMDQPDTRLWLYQMLEESGPLQEPFTGNSTTFYNCGRSSLGRRVMAQLLERFPEQYFMMVKENAGGIEQ
jgi:hypothetical protein